jgi:hypothetical protein
MPLVGQAAYFLAEHSRKDFAAKYAAYDAGSEQQKAGQIWGFWLKSGPTIILCLVPIVAAILKLLHLGTGWRYGEHLVFAIHLQCFTMAGFLAWALINEHWKAASLLPFGCMLLYPALALRRVYRSGWLVLLARWAALLFLEFQFFSLLFWTAYLFSLA